MNEPVEVKQQFERIKKAYKAGYKDACEMFNHNSFDDDCIKEMKEDWLNYIEDNIETFNNTMHSDGLKCTFCGAVMVNEKCPSCNAKVSK